MNAIELSLARAQLGAAVLATLFGAAIFLFINPQSAKDLLFGALCVIATYAVIWPFHALAQAGGQKALILEAVLIPVRIGILVALALFAVENIARPGAPFALGIAIPVIAGSIACLWVSAKDPRYYWVTLAKTPVLRARQKL